MRRQLAIAGVLVGTFLAALVAGVVIGGGEPPDATLVDATPEPIQYQIDRDSDVPALPFDDNPDPSQCGIPVQWGDNGQAWLSGVWEGELIQSEVLVYNSHLRTSVTGGAPHGTEVQVLLFQENPVLDYYFVRIPGDPVEEGWVPEPFLSFDPVT